MLDSAGLLRAAARVVAVMDRADDTRALRLRVIDEIRRVVAFDAYAWLVTDPATSVGAAPIADISGAWLSDLPTHIRLKYLTKITRWTTLDTAPIAVLREATEGDLSRSVLWQGVLRRHDIVDAVSVVFSDRFGCWGFLDLWRSSRLGPFLRPEVDFISALVEPATTALRRCQANTFSLRQTGSSAQLGPIVLLLSPDLRVLAQTAETESYLRTLVPPSENRSPVPASAYNVGAQLLAVEAGVDDNPPTARVHLVDGVWLTLRAARIGDEPGVAEQDIAVTIERSSPVERVDLFGRACGLSPRERQLLDHLVAGADTRQMAHSMFLTENTIQDHLKSVFVKTATRTRRALLANALGG